MNDMERKSYMRRITAIILAVMLAVGMCSNTFAADRSVTLENGGFEQGSVGWTTMNSTLNIAGGAQSGEKCGEVVMSQAYGRAMYKCQFTKGVRYRVSVYVKLKEGYNTASLIVDHRSFGDKSLIKSVVKDVRVNSESWTKLTGIYEFSGVGTGEAYIYVRIGDALTPVTFYMDSLAIEYYGNVPETHSETVTSDGEMAVNSGFDDGISGYITNGAQLVYCANDGAEGTLGCGMVSASGSCSVGQKVSLLPNTKYRVMAYVKSGRGDVNFDIAFQADSTETATDKYIKDYSRQGSKNVPCIAGGAKTVGSEWRRIEAEMIWQSPEKCDAYVFVRANVQKGSLLYIDNFSIIPIETFETEHTNMADEGGLFVDGLRIAETALISGNAVFAPIEPVAAALGAEYSFDGALGVAEIKKGFVNIRIDVKEETASASGRVLPLARVYTENGAVVSDIAAISRTLLAEIEIDETVGAVKIKSRKESGLLANLAKSMIDSKSARIGFIGGAAMAGYGASKRNESSYRALVMKWLRNRYTDCEFIELNNAVSVTGSDLEVYRIGGLLSENPDVIFVDFCPEDAMRTDGKVEEYLSSLVYAVRTQSPQTDIVFLESWSEAMSEDYLAENTPQVIQIYDSVAQKWGIPVINMGRAMFDKATANKQTMLKNYMLYLWYPNDAGHSFYADMICGFIEEQLKSPAEPTAAASVQADGVTVGRTEGIVNAEKGDFDIKTDIYGNEYLEGDAGDELTFKFSGSSVGVMWITGFDTGIAEYEIDGKKAGEAVAFDSRSARAQKMHYAIFEDGLSEGEHTLRIRVSERRDVQSLGNKIKITGFIVGEKTE